MLKNKEFWAVGRRKTSVARVKLSEGTGKITVNVKGGGVTGQVQAIRHALARALVKASIDSKSPLKKAGFLTRDSRMVERKKYGLHKARRGTQFSKR